MSSNEKLFIIFIIFFMMSKFLTAKTISDKEYSLMPDLFYFDNYDKCMLMDDEALYCSITIHLYPFNTKNTSKIWNLIQQVSLNKYNYRHDILRHKICVSELLNITKNDSQLVQKLEKFYNNKYINININSKIKYMKCESQESQYSVDIYDLLYGYFISMYVSFVLLATVYEGIILPRNDAKHVFTDTFLGKIVTPFSLTRNWSRLKTINWNESDVQNLRCIQGVRFYNMIIVIIGHTTISNLAASVSNPVDVENMKNNVIYAFLGLGKYIILTYFLISSWLLSYYFFLAWEQRGKITLKHLILIIIYRYIRLTPALAVVIGFHGTWFVHFLRGPIWDELAGEDYRLCRQNWWANLLYVNNYVNKKQMCIGQTWYMAVDTQYYILGLILLLLMVKNEKSIKCILSSVLIYHIITFFCIFYWNKWDSTGLLQPEIIYNRNLLKTDLWHMTSSSITSNLPGFVAGLWYGYLYYQYRNQQFFTKKFHVVLWWIIILVVPIASSLLPALLPLRSQFFSSVYNSVSRTTFIFSIGFGIFGITQGLGCMIKKICEWPPTYILGRLTYSAYLVHIFFQRLQEGTKRHPTYFASHVICIESIGNIAMSYVGALFLTLFVEMPVSELQKRLLPKERKEQNVKNPKEKVM